MTVLVVGFYELGIVGEGFHFLLPEHLEHELQLGRQVEATVAGIPRRGIVLGVAENYSHVEDLVPIGCFVKHPYGVLLQEWQCKIILWMAWYYRSPMHKVLRLFLPEKIWLGSYQPNIETFFSLTVPIPEVSQRAKKVLELVEYMKQKQTILEEDLKRDFSSAIIKKAKEQGLLQVKEGKLRPVHLIGEVNETATELQDFTLEQQELYDQIIKGSTYVLHGVTGAGKTEIYLHLAHALSKKGQQCLLLVPEIALTPQLLLYFQRIFGEHIALFHSRLSQGEKHQEWLRVHRGEVQVIIGSRSALFSPFQNLGAIIVDEEHEWTYKNEQNPRYLTRSVVDILSQQLSGLTVVYGSATPSVETMFATTEEGGAKYQLLSLSKKIYQQTKRRE